MVSDGYDSAGITKLSELTIDTQGYFKTDIGTVATALNGTATADGALFLRAFQDAYLSVVCNHTNLTAANLNLFCDHANLPSAKIKALLDTASVTVASQLGAMLEGTQLTAANAATFCNAGTVTDDQLNAACDNAIMSSARIKAILDIGTVIVASHLGAMLEGTQLTAANAAAVVEAHYTATQVGNAYNNAIMGDARVNAICDDALSTTARIKAILDTGVVTTAGKLGACLEGTQLTAVNAATVCNEKYTDPQKAAAFDNAIMSTARIAAIFNEAGFSVANKALVFNEAGLTAASANAICDHANLTSDNEQAILYQMITDHAFSKLIDIITDGQSDVTISANTQIEDTTIYKDVTVDSGYTLTLHTASDSKSGILIARTITNNGTITRTPQGRATPTWGGTPSAGIIYRVGTDVVGTGGAGGTGAQYNGGGGGKSGAAGGGDVGNGGDITYTTQTAAEIHDILYQATINYFIVSIQGKSSPTATVSFPDIYGTAGGSGAGNCGGKHGGGGLIIVAKTLTNSNLIYADGEAQIGCWAGQGGNSGGEIIIAVNDYNNTGGTIRANGSDGSTGCYISGGGGGGGGGVEYILYKIQNGAGTLTVAGASGGAGNNGGTAGAAGSVGTATAIDITA